MTVEQDLYTYTSICSLGLDGVENMSYGKELENEFIEILKKSDSGAELSFREACMLFHYARHKNEPEYQFVKDYFTPQTTKKAKKKSYKKFVNNAEKTAEQTSKKK